MRAEQIQRDGPLTYQGTFDMPDQSRPAVPHHYECTRYLVADFRNDLQPATNTSPYQPKGFGNQLPNLDQVLEVAWRTASNNS